MLYEIHMKFTRRFGNFYSNASQAVIQSHKAEKSGKILITRLKKWLLIPTFFFPDKQNEIKKDRLLLFF